MAAHKNHSFVARLRFAIAGLRHGWRTEKSLRTHALAVVLLLSVLAVLRPAVVWWALTILVSAAVIAAELFNTALEHLADHLHPDQHPQIRIVKDSAAAAVLVLAVAALAIAVALLISLERS